MTQICDFLERASAELADWKLSPEASPFETSWLDRLAQRLLAASRLDPVSAESQARDIAHSFLDGGPDNEVAAPSFGSVVQLLQHQGRRR